MMKNSISYAKVSKCSNAHKIKKGKELKIFHKEFQNFQEKFTVLAICHH